MPDPRRLLAAIAVVALLNSTGNALLLAAGPTTERHAECDGPGSIAGASSAHASHEAPPETAPDPAEFGGHDCQQSCPPLGCPAMSTCLKAPIAIETATQGFSHTAHRIPADVDRSTPTSRAITPDTPPPRG